MTPESLVVVTGANSGIGYETTRALATDHRIVMVCRSASKATAARDAVLRDQQDARIDIELADFADLQQVADLAHRLRARYPQIAVLINNAGLYVAEPLRSVNGHELTFAVNHLAPFLLTNLLRDQLRAGRARVVNVSSAAHFAARPDFARIADVAGFNGWRAYSDSKLCNILFSNELARRMSADGVTSNSLHPGMVATNFGAGGDALTRTFFGLMRPLMLSAARGAETQIYLADSPEVAGVSGAYFSSSRRATPSPVARDARRAAELWQLSAGLTARWLPDGTV